MLGTLAGGLVTGSPQTAATGGYLGAATAGSIALIKNREQAQERTENTQDALAQQQQTIVSLQNERAQLNECKEEETPLAQCGSVQATATHAAPDTSDEPDWNSSQFDLEKQIEIQQDYIAKLQAQIGDLKHEMQNP
jgi:predicted lipid-binding transport protein (Tim44 family)